MEYSLTLFKSIFDNKTHKRMDFSSYAQFEQLLFELSRQKRPDKKSAPLITPAIYNPDTTRANENVICWAGWCAVDVDDQKFEGELEKELTTIAGRRETYAFYCLEAIPSNRYKKGNTSSEQNNSSVLCYLNGGVRFTNSYNSNMLLLPIDDCSR